MQKKIEVNGRGHITQNYICQKLLKMNKKTECVLKVNEDNQVQISQYRKEQDTQHYLIWRQKK